MTDRGQAHTLEAVAAGVMLLASVVFALQVTAVTPLTASTASQHIENQQAGIAEGVLDAAIENGTLKQAVLYWNDDNGTFHNTEDSGGVYTLGGPPIPFGEELNETFLDRGIAFDLTYRYVDANERVRTIDVVDLGTPSDHAVTVRRTITLFDDDTLYDADGTENGSLTVADSDTFYASDAAGSHVYNVIEVELTVWRM